MIGSTPSCGGGWPPLNSHFCRVVREKWECPLCLQFCHRAARERRRCPQFCLRRQLFQHSLPAKSLLHRAHKTAPQFTLLQFSLRFLVIPRAARILHWRVQSKTGAEQVEEHPRGQSIWCKIPCAKENRYANPEEATGDLESKCLKPLGNMDVSKKGPDAKPAWTGKAVKILSAFADTEQAPNLTDGIKLLAGKLSAQVKTVNVSEWRLDKLGKWSNEAQELLSCSKSLKGILMLCGLPWQTEGMVRSSLH